MEPITLHDPTKAHLGLLVSAVDDKLADLARFVNAHSAELDEETQLVLEELVGDLLDAMTLARNFIAWHPNNYPEGGGELVYHDPPQIPGCRKLSALIVLTTA